MDEKEAIVGGLWDVWFEQLQKVYRKDPEISLGDFYEIAAEAYYKDHVYDLMYPTKNLKSFVTYF